MLRVLLCVSCCSAPPPNNRTAKRRGSSNRLLNGAPNKGTSQDSTKKELNGKEEIENDQLLPNTLEAGRDNYDTKSGDSQGKLIPPLGDENTSFDVSKYNAQSIQYVGSTATSAKLQLAGAIDHDNSIRLEGVDAKFSSHQDYSASLSSSVEIGPFGESVGTIASHLREEARSQGETGINSQQLQPIRQFNDYTSFDARQNEKPMITGQPYEPLSTASKNVPSTTKIGDYARLEYSPVEDLESVTTMSYSRFGSEKGGSHSQVGSTLSRQNSLRANFYDEPNSRRSSQCGVESTSISIASQLSNEQFQQNLTNMLESVNSNYQTIGAIGLPLGPPIDGTQTETTKTSPETPGAALTSASQESLSDGAFNDISPPSSRLGTLMSSTPSGAALVGDHSERSNLIEELADFSQPAPIATGEDEYHQFLESDSNANANYPKNEERMGSPHSITTTTSGGLTNPTPTPSEMSSGSGKKKRLGAKALLKKLRPGKKKNRDELK